MLLSSKWILAYFIFVFPFCRATVFKHGQSVWFRIWVNVSVTSLCLMLICSLVVDTEMKHIHVHYKLHVNKRLTTIFTPSNLCSQVCQKGDAHPNDNNEIQLVCRENIYIQTIIKRYNSYAVRTYTSKR